MERWGNLRARFGELMPMNQEASRGRRSPEKGGDPHYIVSAGDNAENAPPVGHDDNDAIGGGGGGGGGGGAARNPNGDPDDCGGRDDPGGPPVDDCCPICFGSFAVPCKANCGHWFCGSCILQYWNYCAASKPCKCPMCTRGITKLTPEAVLFRGHQEQEVTKVLEGVQRYNRLFVGGVRGLVRKLCEAPFLMKRMFVQMMDPDRADYNLHEMRVLALVLSILYAASPFDFIPRGGVGVFRLFDYIAIVIVLVLRLAGTYRRRRLTQRVRNLAAAELLGE